MYKSGKEIPIQAIGKSTYASGTNNSVGYIDPNLTLPKLIDPRVFGTFTFQYAFAENKNDPFDPNALNGLVEDGKSLYGFIKVSFRGTYTCTIKVPLKVNVVYLDDIITQHTGGYNYGNIPYCYEMSGIKSYNPITFSNEVLHTIRTDRNNRFDPDPLLLVDDIYMEHYNADAYGNIDLSSPVRKNRLHRGAKFVYTRFKYLGRKGVPNASTDPGGEVFEDIRLSLKGVKAPGKRVFMMRDLFSCSTSVPATFDLTKSEATVSQPGSTFQYSNSSGGAILNPNSSRARNSDEAIYMEMRNVTPTGCNLDYKFFAKSVSFSYGIPASGDVYCEGENTLLSTLYNSKINNSGSNYAIVYYEGDPQNRGTYIEKIRDITQTGIVKIYAQVFDGTLCTETINFDITVTPHPKNFFTFQLCAGSPTFLKDFDQNLLNGRNPSNFSVEYYSFEPSDISKNTTTSLTSLTSLINKNGISIVNNSVKIWAMIEDKNSGCFSIEEMTISTTPPPSINSGVSFIQCDDEIKDRLTTYDLNSYLSKLTNQSGISASFYKNDPTQNPTAPKLSNIYRNTVPSEVIYAQVTDQNGCKSAPERVTLVINANLHNPTPVDRFSCDDTDGIPGNQIGIFPIAPPRITPIGGQSISYYRTLVEGARKQNPITNINAYKNTSSPETIYRRIDDNRTGDCKALDPYLNLSVITNPVIKIRSDSKYLCTGSSNPLKLDADLSGINTPSNYTFQWNSGASGSSINVSMPGTYQMIYTDTNYGCRSLSNAIKVEQREKPSIKSIEQISSVGDSNNRVKVLLNNPSRYSNKYEYNIDDAIGFQKSNIFEGVTSGKHLVRVRDEFCGVSKKLVRVMNYPKFFTPNNDGINDLWSLEAFSDLGFLRADIFDRYGTFITSLDSANFQWDGSFKNINLPSDDYWFQMRYRDINENGNIKTLIGHFTLKR
ncbi:gliding motility-associated C-terminal domain-containing protein [Elysia marginata]|uniref:Gliding motility-associated C-terminal domain-containing protein n=1 Tax=Elysia marginata TaxID=1093978 RepID=A0AAV4G6R3_9GAST|nr:gliding motility-associated C-terminal domain-containing protein [Elysia marginata]